MVALEGVVTGKFWALKGNDMVIRLTFDRKLVAQNCHRNTSILSYNESTFFRSLHLVKMNVQFS